MIEALTVVVIIGLLIAANIFIRIYLWWQKRTYNPNPPPTPPTTNAPPTRVPPPPPNQGKFATLDGQTVTYWDIANKGWLDTNGTTSATFTNMFQTDLQEASAVNGAYQTVYRILGMESASGTLVYVLDTNGAILAKTYGDSHAPSIVRTNYANIALPASTPAFFRLKN